MIKPGVDVAGIRPELVLAYAIAQPIFASHGAVATITSCKDGKHMRGSLHYVGLAIDLRTSDLAPDHWLPVTEQLNLALGPQYDVVLETDHIHIEMQPKWVFPETV